MLNPKIKLTDFGIYVMVDDTHLSRWVEQDRRLDHARGYIEKFKQYIPLGGTVIDCGTSIGDHTVTYAQIVGPEGRVFGFEANPDVAECCQLNLKPYPWATIWNIGLSDGPGQAEISVNPNVGASYLTEGRGVKLIGLDDIVEDFARIDFIKVDIEGFEPKMLRGARVAIKKFSPVILMEVNSGCLTRQGSSEEEIFSELRKLGYSWEVADGQANTPQYDIIAKKAK